MNSKADQTLEFLSLIQDRPPLWQKQHKDFMNRDIREKLFQEIAEKTGQTVQMCRKKLKTLKDKMRDITNKLPKTKSGQPAFEKGANVVRWSFYEPMLFMKDQFVGREMQGSFHVSTEDESLQENSMLTAVDSEDDASTHSSLPPSEVPKPIQPKQGRMAKKARLEEQFLSLEREKLTNLKKVLAAEECKEQMDEWGTFCHALKYDLRKVTDPYLIMQVKNDINRIVHDAVLKQLQRNCPPPSTNCSSQPMLFRQEQFMGTYHASTQENIQQEEQHTFQLLP